MKVVVDIPNWLYNAMMEHREPHYSQSLGDAVRDGTPLPKGHGRLIDESKITKCEQVGLIIKDDNIIRCFKTDAPTIIEADGGNTE